MLILSSRLSSRLFHFFWRLSFSLARGDSLIAGYNTANEKEKDKYYAERLRKLVGGVMFLVCAVMWLPDILGKPDSKQLYYVVTAIIVIAAIAVVVLANTWAKKK